MQADLRLCCLHMAKTGFLMTWLITKLREDLPSELCVEGNRPAQLQKFLSLEILEKAFGYMYYTI